MEQLRFKDENGNDFPKWKKTKIEYLFKAYSHRAGKQNEHPLLTSSLSGIYLQNEYFDRITSSIDTSDYKVIPRGYFTYRSMSDTGVFRFNIQNRIDKGIISPAYPVFINLANTNKEFLFYNLNYSSHIKRQLLMSKQGGTRYALPFSRFSSLYIMVPTIKEQEKIGGFLSAFDRLIEKQKEKIELLSKQKEFTVSNFFGYTKTNPLKDNSMEWRYSKLGKHIKCFSGGTPVSSKSEYYNGKIPFIRSSEIDKHTTELYISEEALKNSSAKLVEKGDLLFAMYGATSGKTAISKIDGAINQAILAIRSEEFNLNYLNIYFKAQRSVIVRKYTQGGQPNLSSKIIKSLLIPKPPLNVQGYISEFVSRLERLVDLEVIALNKYIELKKAYLYRVFN